MRRTRAGRPIGESGGVFTGGVYRGDEEIPDAFWRSLTAPSLFAEPKAVILRRADSLPDDFWPRLKGPLSGFSAHVWPMICLEKPFGKKGPPISKALASQPYYQVAEKRRWIWTSPGPTRRDMAPMRKDWAATKGPSLAPAVPGALAAALPGDGAMAGGAPAEVAASRDRPSPAASDRMGCSSTPGARDSSRARDTA